MLICNGAGIEAAMRWERTPWQYKRIGRSQVVDGYHLDAGHPVKAKVQGVKTFVQFTVMGRLHEGWIDTQDVED